ncbi:MAG: helix-turn-helix transcriptional regulator [Solirubrobacteraceae bacterium]|jgi:hypothetical protein|nr:helix-turn-helix transcriptional regulator [Solirubrobacteraceae bacterium]
MTDAADLLARFVDDWHAGRRPDVDQTLGQAAPEQRAELADALSAFLAIAPTPNYDETTLAELAEQPAVTAAVEAFTATAPDTLAAARRPWPQLVAEWRQRAGLSVDAAARRVLEAAGLHDANVGRAAEYLYGFESGQHKPEQASPRLLDVLARALGVSRAELGPAATAALLRADEERRSDVWRFEVLADAMTTAPHTRGDPVDELFFG